ncbi:MAG: hypothetical protein J6S41_07725 [Clostridia bacterium]|nr:hypothetical protein [Clostridia bacterium]
MMKIKFVSALAVLLLLTGCSPEIENYAIVAGAALDMAQEGLELTVEVADVSSGSAQSSGESLTFTAAGSDIAEAQKALERHMGKPLYWDHSSVIVLSRDLCRAGIEPAVTWIMSSQAVRISVPLVVSTGSAKDLLSSKLDPYKTTAFGLRSMLDNNADRGIGIALPVYQLYNRLESHSGSALLPLLNVEKDKPVLIGSAIISDYRYIDSLSVNQTQIYTLMTDAAKEALLSIGSVSMRTSRTASDLSYKDGVCRFRMRIQGVLDQGYLPEGENPVQALAQNLTEQAQQLVEVSRTMDCDFLGLNDARYKAQPHDFTRLAVADIPVEITPDIHIYDYGQAQ